MSEVKRFYINGRDWEQEEDPSGDLVSASDYDALAAQRDEGLAREAELRAALLKARSWIESARDGVLYPIAQDFDGVVGMNAEGLGSLTPGLLDNIDKVLASPGCADGEKA